MKRDPPPAAARHPITPVKRVVVFVSGYPPAYLGGGPIRTVHAMLSTASRDFTFLVVTPDSDLGADKPLAGIRSNEWDSRTEAKVFYSARRSIWPYLRSALDIGQKSPDILYVNGFFGLKFAILPQLLHALGVFGRCRLVVAPRGELTPGALSFKRIKKSSYLALYRLLHLPGRATWHASSGEELGDIRSVLGDVRGIVRANETLLPEQQHAASHAEPGLLRLVFVSRIVRKKGLDTVLRALALLSGENRRRINLRIVGPAEDPSYLRECKDIAGTLPATTQVSYDGPVPHSVVGACFRDSDAFIFPTHSENFGQVIAESLASSCPVIASTSTPWTDLLNSGAGRSVCSLEPAAWAREIEWLANLDDAQLNGLKRRSGQAYVGWRRDQGGPSIFELMSSLPGGSSVGQ